MFYMYISSAYKNSLGLNVLYVYFQCLQEFFGIKCFICIFPVPTRILWFVFVALRPKSTAMVIAGRSVHLTTLFPGQA